MDKKVIAIMFLIAISINLIFYATPILMKEWSYISTPAQVVVEFTVKVRRISGYQYKLEGQICIQDLNGTIAVNNIPWQCLSLGQYGRIIIELGHTYNIEIRSGSYVDTTVWIAPNPPCGVPCYVEYTIVTKHFTVGALVYKTK